MNNNINNSSRKNNNNYTSIPRSFDPGVCLQRFNRI